jgi:pimeloyl-ACP methyl ester carboxylesterase
MVPSTLAAGIVHFLEGLLLLRSGPCQSEDGVELPAHHVRDDRFALFALEEPAVELVRRQELGLWLGTSSGAALALEAANALPTKVKKAALFEPPFMVDDSRPPMPAEFVARVTELVEKGRRGDAVAFFMTDGVRVPAEQVAAMKTMPMWSGLEKTAHTLAYDGKLMEGTQGGKPLPPGRWKDAAMPVLVMVGGRSEAWMKNAGAALEANLAAAEIRTIEGQDHSAPGRAPATLVPALLEFFGTAKR